MRQARFKSIVASYACICFVHILCGCSSRHLALLNTEVLPCVVQVHRGVYVAAEILYERFKPMVEEQLASSPFAKIAFTVSPCRFISLPQSFCQTRLCSPHVANISIWKVVHQLVRTSWTALQCVHDEFHFTSCCFCIAGNLHGFGFKNSPTTKQHTA